MKKLLILFLFITTPAFAQSVQSTNAAMGEFIFQRNWALERSAQAAMQIDELNKKITDLQKQIEDLKKSKDKTK